MTYKKDTSLIRTLCSDPSGSTVIEKIRMSLLPNFTVAKKVSEGVLSEGAIQFAPAILLRTTKLVHDGRECIHFLQIATSVLQVKSMPVAKHTPIDVGHETGV